VLEQRLRWVFEELAHETRRRTGESVGGGVCVMLDDAADGARRVDHPQEILYLVKDDEAATVGALMERGRELKQALEHGFDVNAARSLQPRREAAASE